MGPRHRLCLFTSPFPKHKTQSTTKQAGGSSGIGKAIVQKLASQGINVVVAALDDKFLKVS